MHLYLNLSISVVIFSLEISLYSVTLPFGGFSWEKWMVWAHGGRREVLRLMEVSFDEDEEVSHSESGSCAQETRAPEDEVDQIELPLTASTHHAQGRGAARFTNSTFLSVFLRHVFYLPFNVGWSRFNNSSRLFLSLVQSNFHASIYVVLWIHLLILLLWFTVESSFPRLCVYHTSRGFLSSSRSR